MLEKIVNGIYRVKVPFENIYTSVFLLRSGDDGLIIIDSGDSEADAENYVIPAVSEMGGEVKVLVASHTHGDHFGGMGALRKAYPSAKLCLFSENEGVECAVDGERLDDRFSVLNLKGHSADCLAVWDNASRTLISGDSLQMCGIGRYGTSIGDFDGYFESIGRVKKLCPERIAAAHKYVPLGEIAEGEAAVSEFLGECEAAAMRVLEFAEKHCDKNDVEIAELFCEEYKELPLIGADVMSAARKYKKK